MSYKIIGKYIKELNFIIPNPKTFSLLSKNIANYKINIDNEAFELFEKNFNKNINSCVSCAFIDKLNRYSITFYSLNYYIKKFH